MSYRPDDLRPGDIILVEGRSLLDRAIEWATASPLSHAALVGDGELIEANWPVVRTVPLGAYAADGWAFGVKAGTVNGDGQRRKAVGAAQSRLGQRYGVTALFEDGARYLLHLPLYARLNPRRLTCSGLVAWSWQQAGIRLTWAILPSPYDLACSPVLDGPRPWRTRAA